MSKRDPAKPSHHLVVTIGILAFLVVMIAIFLSGNPNSQAGGHQRENATGLTAGANAEDIWVAPDTSLIPAGPEGDLIRYGRELVTHTAVYLGPKSNVKPISNGMNCQNCHLEAGTKPFGNNYSAVAATYPKYRDRSGTIEPLEKRVNDCIERSLNGQRLEEASREMRAFIAYIFWVGKDVTKGVSPEGSGLVAVPFLSRPADPEKGRKVYKTHCQVCHGINGGGALTENGTEWLYPPLYGDNSYNTGAGLFRLSRLAGYVKANMPFGVRYDSTVLSDEESWDVAAYINSRPRPVKDISMDWPDVSTKPFDHPFGPYVDHYSEEEHKFGPFGSIKRNKGTRLP